MFNPNNSPYGSHPRQFNPSLPPYFNRGVQSPNSNSPRSPYGSPFTPERYPSRFSQHGPSPDYWSPHGNPSPRGFVPSSPNQFIGDRYNRPPPPIAAPNFPPDVNQQGFYGSPMNPHFENYQNSTSRENTGNLSSNLNSPFVTTPQDRSWDCNSSSYQTCRGSSLWSTPNSSFKQKKSFGRRANFQDSISASLSDPWESLKPRKTPEAGCLVVQPVAQRHTVLFTSFERRRKAEDILKETDTKRSHNTSSDVSFYPQSPPSPSAIVMPSFD